MIMDINKKISLLMDEILSGAYIIPQMPQAQNELSRQAEAEYYATARRNMTKDFAHIIMGE
ncbi:hypothetical protein [Agathobacter rectalis]|uniref:Uncharacterized protein n=1 Tax=Agathobacter rectalis TaxID=39491 RepID=A0A3E4YKW1_9FIRM|nr:hypothetical protein [Agathobacter rectalis]RGM75340.1 hypothetical protein DXB99_02045 [Agathobacter rectalis]